MARGESEEGEGRRKGERWREEKERGEMERGEIEEGEGRKKAERWR
jgi:hypothetical protein